MHGAGSAGIDRRRRRLARRSGGPLSALVEQLPLSSTSTGWTTSARTSTRARRSSSCSATRSGVGREPRPLRRDPASRGSRARARGAPAHAHDRRASARRVPPAHARRPVRLGPGRGARRLRPGAVVLQGYLLDVTARHEAEEQLRHQAFHDALTGLANRALFTDRVEHALVLRSRSHGAEVAVLFLDLDDFKGVNDTLGHAAGDTLLRGVGVRLRDSLSPSYTVARLGGDEFAVLIEEVAGPASAVDAARADRRDLQKPFEIEGREVFVSASVGIALGDDATTSCALPTSRCIGRRRAEGAVRHLHADDGRRPVGRLELVAELRRARRRGVRRSLPAPRRPRQRRGRRRRGARPLGASDARLMQPGEFISLAEETRNIVEIGALGADRGLRAGRALARGDIRRGGSDPERERLDPPGSHPGSRRRGPRGARPSPGSRPSADARVDRERARSAGTRSSVPS